MTLSLQKVAADTGLSREEVATEVARSLPQLTPDGSLPQGDTSLEELIRRQRL
ncbi:YidB family protein [Streptomyces sp. NPDC003035]|uniref:YidB family protein n=1 Tax=Streptomyces sp. NPDC003035 TaxID=3364676 RepID=UPI00367AF12E